MKYARLPAVCRGPLAAALLLSSAVPSLAQSGENVAVVINEASTASVRIGEYYAKVRNVPATNVIRIKTTEEESIERGAYLQTVEQPIASVLSREALQDRVLYVVLTKGVPLRITGTEGREGTTASVDSELTLLYRRMTGRPVPVAGRVPNPYFLGGRPIREAQPFTHRTQDIFLVARLDGFDVRHIIALIDRGLTPSTEGRIVLDQRSGLSDAVGDAWLGETAARLRDLGHSSRVVLERTTRAARNVDDVLGYYSWGSNDPENRVRRVGMRFLPGALAATFTSSDARTFQAPPAHWAPSDERANRTTWFAGSPQTLAGDLVEEGVTGVAGNVSEPYLDGAIRPDILFPTYLTGFNLVEAFYLALPHLSWQTVVIGDPLCAPFRKAVLTSTEIEEPLDAETELPALFSKARMDVARAAMKGVPLEAISLVVRADSRRRRGDPAGARQALEHATAIAPHAGGAQLQLALLYEDAGAFDEAAARYRLVLETQPDSIVALNNLAYSLAVRQKVPEEALPLARRAVALAPDSPTIVDTLAWVEHLLGNHKAAASLLTPIVQKSTGNAEIHLHAAIVFGAIGERGLAEAQLKEALQLDPRLADRKEVRIIRAPPGAPD